MGFRETWRALRFLSVAARGRLRSADFEGTYSVDERKIPYLAYPSKTFPSGPWVMICHGLNEKGPRDERMIRLAMAFAKSGISAFLPSFPEAAELRMDPIMSTEIAAAFSKIRSEHRLLEPSAVFGISFSGTLSLRGISNLSMEGRPSSMIMLGAYADLNRLIEYAFSERLGKKKASMRELPPSPYLAHIFELNFGKIESEKDLERIRSQQEILFGQLGIPNDLDLKGTFNVLVLHSSNDDIVPARHADLLSKRLKNHAKVEKEILEIPAHARLALFARGQALLRSVRKILSLFET